METKVMSVAEVLRITVDILSNITVPVGLMNQIAVPVNNAIQNLMQCIDAEEAAEKEAKCDEET